MAFAALTAGLAFSNTRTALAHSISYDMTMHHGLPHGIACSFTLGMVLQRAIGKSAERDAVLARVFDVPLAAGARGPARLPRGPGRQHPVRELRRVRGRVGAHDHERARRRARQELHRRLAAPQRPPERQHECQGIAPRGDADRRRVRPPRPRHRGLQSLHRAAHRHGAEGDGRGREAGLRDRQGLQVQADALRARRDPEQGGGDRRAAAPTSSPTSSPPRAACARRTRSTRSAGSATCCSSAPASALKDDGQIFSCDLTPHGKKRRVYTQRDPLLGVISAITPFNHPMNQVAHKVVPSIVTNNRMVLKPSEKVPFSAIVLADILYEAGLPPEMYQVVTGDPKEIADELITNEHVDLVTFTGGVAIGKYIAVEGRLPADGARARRQRSDHRHGRRRPRGGGDARRRRLVQELGPALHRGQAHAGAALGRRPLRRAAGGQDQGLVVRRPDGRRSSTWAR